MKSLIVGFISFCGGLIVALFFVTLLLISLQAKRPLERTTALDNNTSISVQENSISLEQNKASLFSNGAVFICKGPSSKRYHLIKGCRGLKNCSTRIYEVSLSEAKEIGRTLCGYED